MVVKHITNSNINETILQFIYRSGPQLNTLYNTDYDWTQFPITGFLANHVLIMAFNDDNLPIGLLAATVHGSFFDRTKIILRQELLYSHSPKATCELLRYFIDFGRLRANHVITCIGEHTNIKPASLKRLGFTELETLYRMEV